jgi:pimeloyl-ACP methyl ester carboxylesterase
VRDLWTLYWMQSDCTAAIWRNDFGLELRVLHGYELILNREGSHAAVGQASAEDKFFTSDGVRLRYVERGQGEPVVLLHGNGSWIETMWADTGVIDGLSTRYHVIALDFRGYGKSGKPHDPAAYGPRMGDDVVHLLDHLGVKRAHIVGYSMGARITSWLVVNRPERLISATLGASTYYLDTSKERQSLEASAREAELGSSAERIKHENPTMTDAQVAKFVAERAKMNDPRAVAAAQRGMTGIFIGESALAGTKVPILHIIGSLDTSRLAASHRLKDKVLPTVEFRIVDGATHTGPAALFRRQEFVETVKAFLGRHPLGL